MAIEIERKFLVDETKLPELSKGVQLAQGYLPTSDNTVVRVRLAGSKAFLTIKGENYASGDTAGAGDSSSSRGISQISRSEFEYEIPVGDAKEMLGELCGAVVEKTRYSILHGGHTWELDIFSGHNSGLVVAEIELDSQSATFSLPPWVTAEVSDDTRYFNSSLAQAPFDTWRNSRT